MTTAYVYIKKTLKKNGCFCDHYFFHIDIILEIRTIQFRQFMLYESSWFFATWPHESADPLRTFRPGIWRWIPYAAPRMARVPDRDWVGGWSVRIPGRHQKMPNSWYQSCHFRVLYKKQLELDHRCMGFRVWWFLVVVFFVFGGVLGWWLGFFGQLRFFLKHVNVMNVYN